MQGHIAHTLQQEALILLLLLLLLNAKSAFSYFPVFKLTTYAYFFPILAIHVKILSSFKKWTN